MKTQRTYPIDLSVVIHLWRGDNLYSILLTWISFTNVHIINWWLEPKQTSTIQPIDRTNNENIRMTDKTIATEFHLSSLIKKNILGLNNEVVNTSLPPDTVDASPSLLWWTVASYKWNHLCPELWSRADRQADAGQVISQAQIW